jgi:putative ABC transport system ATP-binding protein
VILDVRNVGKRYLHADGPVNALENVTLTVPEGRFVTITGPSGSGKSTLLLCVGGLIRPTSGEMYFRDRALHALSDAALAAFRREHLGFVMQSFSLVPYLTAVRNVMLPLAWHHVSRADQEGRARDILRQVGLEGRANHLPRELSMGQQQRVAIARAFVHDPDLILADEPTGNLDPGLSDDILDLLGGLNRDRGTTIVMVTHSPSAAARGTLRVHLEEGRVVGSADPSGASTTRPLAAHGT